MTHTTRIARADYSSRLNAMYNDTERDEFAFWSLLKAYVARCLNSRVDQKLLEEATQDCLIQIHKSLPHFKADADHKGSSFTRWVTGLVWRRANDATRSWFSNKEEPISQKGSQLNESGEYEAPDITTFSRVIGEDEYFEALDAELRPDRVSAALDQIYELLLSPKDRRIFALLRKGVKPTEVSRRLGLKRTYISERRKQWKRIAERAGINITEVLSATQEAA